ncbi:MAG: hypothetical protein GY711_06005 [bacterium]|nr:hypothetical protein [bacterium]
MRYAFFTIPLHDHAQATEELNRFLATHRVVRSEPHLVPDPSGSVWSVCVTYVTDAEPLPKGLTRRRVDYREELSPPEFAVFARLRALRKEMAEHQGIPVFAIFTNEQLAEMVRKRATSTAALQAIDGIGPGRMDKYGAAMLGVLTEMLPGIESAGIEADGNGSA